MRKKERHELIRFLINQHDIDTQETMLKILLENDCKVTQATVSRDINELMLIKTKTIYNNYKYSLPTDRQNYTDKSSKLISLFKESVVSIEKAENIIVTHTLPGGANAACSFIDNLKLDEILGNLAGDDTIFTVVKSAKVVDLVIEELKKYL